MPVLLSRKLSLDSHCYFQIEKQKPRQNASFNMLPCVVRLYFSVPTLPASMCFLVAGDGLKKKHHLVMRDMNNVFMDTLCGHLFFAVGTNVLGVTDRRGKRESTETNSWYWFFHEICQ